MGPADRNSAAKGRYRKGPSQRVKQQVLMEAGYMCANPRCRVILTLEIHHMIWVKDGGGNDPSNLIALCGNCHGLHTKGEIPAEAIRHWKGMLLALNHAFDRKGMDLLLFLHKAGPNSMLYFSADGVLEFAGLFAAGLVQFGSQQRDNIRGTSRHEVFLNHKGTAIVEAWLEGSEGKFKELLGEVQTMKVPSPI